MTKMKTRQPLLRSDVAQIAVLFGLVGAVIGLGAHYLAHDISLFRLSAVWVGCAGLMLVLEVVTWLADRPAAA